MSEKKAAKTPTASGSATGAEGKSPGEIRAKIEATREELGDTVAAVAEKTDVKKQAKAKADEVKAQATAKADDAKLKAKELGDSARPFAIAGAVIALLVLWRLLRR
jgi:hypothetical protein